tara:strand:- start:254 stop:478 length:225 start_codon:yes stop_codon:yes gene_type:complete
MKIFIGWRKLLFAIILTALASIFAYIKNVEFNDWASFMIWIYGSYASTNVGEHFGKSFAQNKGKNKNISEDQNT